MDACLLAICVSCDELKRLEDFDRKFSGVSGHGKCRSLIEKILNEEMRGERRRGTERVCERLMIECGGQGMVEMVFVLIRRFGVNQKFRTLSASSLTTSMSIQDRSH